ncbi:hypothetical protein BJY00DRAFT_320091 [Aspergillus carlsbadensis]|nr:hypothetical protein BJY00DRAFT_320091 [Aspergillus carlsbadensis]
MALGYSSLGAWCLLHPTSALRLSLTPKYTTLDRTPVLIMQCFGAQAMACGLLLGVADMTWKSFLAFGLAMVPYLGFNAWLGFGPGRGVPTSSPKRKRTVTWDVSGSAASHVAGTNAVLLPRQDHMDRAERTGVCCLANGIGNGNGNGHAAGSPESAGGERPARHVACNARFQVPARRPTGTRLRFFPPAAMSSIGMSQIESAFLQDPEPPLWHP